MADEKNPIPHPSLRIKTSPRAPSSRESQGQNNDDNAVILRSRGRSLVREGRAPDANAATDPSNARTDAGPIYQRLSGDTVRSHKFDRPRQLYMIGESRHPLLQATVDELAEEETDYGGATASYASMATFTPVISDAPSSYEVQASFMPSATSPRPFPVQSDSASSLLSRALDSPRPRTVRRARRSSGRSSGSLTSPASAFLSQFNNRELEAPPSEPDDEGQIIGDKGEYVIGEKIGYGGFSVVKQVFTIENDRKVLRAVKIVRKQAKDRTPHQNDMLLLEIEHEITIWRYLKHPNILPLISVYETAFATFCITKLNTGGTLFDLVRAQRRPMSSTSSLGSNSARNAEPIVRKDRGIPLNLVKRYAYQLVSAIRYLHNDVHVVHRDIKLENCLLNPSAAGNSGGTILLCDFGMAEFIRRGDRDPAAIMHSSIGPSTTSTSINGSLQYASPELIEASEPIFSPAVDIWALGVTIFAMLAGELPFTHPLLPKLQNMILEGHWDEDRFRQGLREKQEFTEMEDGDASEEADKAIELIRGCLTMDARMRWSVRRVLESSFLKSCQEEMA